MRRPIAFFAALSCVLCAPYAQAQDLAAAISGALSNAPTLAEAQAGEAAAKARLDRAKAEGNPLLKVEGSYGAGRIDNGGFFGITADNVSPLAAQATAELPLYAGGRISSAVAQARGGADIARFGAEQARLQTIVNAVSAYTELLTARKLEERYSKLATALAETERQAGLRYRTGEIASSELAQARARRAEADAGLAQAQGRRISAEAAYQRLIGSPAANWPACRAYRLFPPHSIMRWTWRVPPIRLCSRHEQGLMWRVPRSGPQRPKACRLSAPLPRRPMSAISSFRVTRRIPSRSVFVVAGPFGPVAAWPRRPGRPMQILLPARRGCVRRIRR